MGRTRIDQLSDEERGCFNEWADKWIDVGLRTGPADRERFEASVRDCYRFAGIPFPEVVVWVPSPLVMAFAAPAAALAIELIEAERRGTLRVGDAVHDAVGGAIDGAVGDAVGDAVRGAIDGAIDDAIDGAVGDAVDGAVRDAVRGAIDDAVGDAEIRKATLDVIARAWMLIIGGQFWAGGWWYGGAWTSYFREVCGLELAGDLWDRARAYEGTIESACWWWPHRRFVMVCERPTEIHRELADPDVTRGWGSHRLHREDGPAVVWQDGWGVYSWHGVRVPADVIEQPETVTAERIVSEANVEVRRAILEKVGYEPLTSVAKVVDADVDQYGRLRELLRIDQADDEAIVLVKVVNSTAEPDGSFKEYVLRVPPSVGSAQKAVAWTFDLDADAYTPLVET